MALGVLSLFSMAHQAHTPTDKTLHLVSEAQAALPPVNIKIETQGVDEKQKPLLSSKAHTTNFLVMKNCLAKNIFFEARGTDEKEKIRIINITMNRLNSGKFADTLCGVVYQHKQFSWTHEARKRTGNVETLYKGKPGELEQWRISQEMAEKALTEGYNDLTHGSLYYHVTYIKKPKSWRRVQESSRSKWHIYYTALNK